MGREFHTKLKVIMGLALAAAIVVAFQNCTPAFEFANLKSEANGNGTGYDGKTYANYGDCPDEAGVSQKSVILLEADGSGLLVRANCQTVNPPKALKTNEIKMSFDGSSALVYDKQVFDYVDQVAESRVTRALCWMSSSPGRTEVRITSSVGTSPTDVPQLSGSITNSSGMSASLSPIVENVMATNQVVYEGCDATGENKLSLQIFISATLYGKLNAKIGGAIMPTISSTECYVNEAVLNRVLQYPPYY